MSSVVKNNVMKKTWQLLSKEEVYGNRWRKIERWLMKTPRGDQGEYFIQRSFDVAIVFGVTPDQKILVLKEFFIAGQEYVYSIVAGIVENGDHALTAKKELREEAGYAADDWVYLGSLLRDKYTTGRIHFHLANNMYRVGEQELEPAEDIETSFVSIEKFKELLVGCQIHDAMEATCSFLALSHLRLL